MQNISCNSTIRVKSWTGSCDESCHDNVGDFLRREIFKIDFDKKDRIELSEIKFSPIYILKGKDSFNIHIRYIDDGKISSSTKIVSCKGESVEVAKLKASIIAMSMGYDIGGLL